MQRNKIPIIENPALLLAGIIWTNRKLIEFPSDFIKGIEIFLCIWIKKKR